MEGTRFLICLSTHLPVNAKDLIWRGPDLSDTFNAFWPQCHWFLHHHLQADRQYSVNTEEAGWVPMPGRCRQMVTNGASGTSSTLKILFNNMCWKRVFAFEQRHSAAQLQIFRKLFDLKTAFGKHGKIVRLYKHFPGLLYLKISKT